MFRALVEIPCGIAKSVPMWPMALVSHSSAKVSVWTGVSSGPASTVTSHSPEPMRLRLAPAYSALMARYRSRSGTCCTVHCLSSLP